MFVERRQGQDSGAEGLLTRRLRRMQRGAPESDSQLSSILDLIARHNLPKLSANKLAALRKSGSSKVPAGPAEADSPLFKTPKISSTRPPSRQRTYERERLQVVSQFTLLPTLKDEDWLEQSSPQTVEHDPRKARWIEENANKYQTPMTTRSHFRTASDRPESRGGLTASNRRLRSTVVSRNSSAIRVAKSKNDSTSTSNTPSELPPLSLRQSVGQILRRKVNPAGASFSQVISTFSRPTYFMEQLRKVLVYKNISSVRDKAYYEQFLKNVKDLTQMNQDALVDEEEYLDKVRLRRILKEEDNSFLPNEPTLPLLVLDLDETLVHCLKPGAEGSSSTVETGYYNDSRQWVGLRINVRPFVREFLEELSSYFVIYVFTASEVLYAKAVVKLVDPQRRFIRRVFDRRFCCVTQKGYVVKDLRIFGREHKVKQILMVDNSSYCFFPQLKNGIPVIPFETNQGDKELIDLGEYLKSIARQPSMVAINSDHFKLDKYGSSVRLEEIASKLFVSAT